MTSNSLIPMTTQSLVPALPRRHMEAVRTVRAGAIISALQMDAAGCLADKASHDVTDLAIIHEAMIKAAPLADENLAKIRDAHADVAVCLIKRMRGS
jgi:hypothetical protein